MALQDAQKHSICTSDIRCDVEPAMFVPLSNDILRR